jgi:chromosome segregation protein
VILRRLQITGFKSFGAKTTLEFERGVTAIVGPNGSGKSNLADAVRWVLGEQHKAKLRLQDRDEVIFAGTATKSPASFAEVALIFDNADGSLPIDLTEVEISRRLYRSGESEYRLAGKTARLSDITEMLVHAGVSPSSYTVIGQGMIDGFLVSSPAERKSLFDEAAGIRGPELGRETAMRKLAATATNLARLRDIATELQPRLEALERVAGTAGEQHELGERIASLKRSIVAGRLARAAAATAKAEAGLAAASEQQAQQVAVHQRLEGELASLQMPVPPPPLKRRKRSKRWQAEDERRQLAGQLSSYKANTEAKIAAEADALRQARSARLPPSSRPPRSATPTSRPSYRNRRCRARRHRPR